MALKASIKEHTAAVLTNIWYDAQSPELAFVCQGLWTLEVDENRVTLIRAKALQAAPTSRQFNLNGQ